MINTIKLQIVFLFSGVPTMLTEMEELPVIKLGDYTLQLELGALSEFGKEVAERELRETPERQQEAVKELRELLKGKVFFSIIYFTI